MQRRYLVTGGTGFIGAAIVKRLVAANHFVRVLDNNSRGAPRRLGSALRDVTMPATGDVKTRSSATERAPVSPARAVA